MPHEPTSPARRCARACLALLLSLPATASAIPLIDGLGGPAGFGTNMLGYNDDGSSAAIDLRRVFPRGVNFYGTTHMTMWVNNNGNVSFRGGIPDFTPAAFPIAGQPMIAPWWGDVDTRGAERPARAGVYWHLEERRIIATWFQVGYYDRHHDKTNSFQLVITPRGACDDGDFDVEFRYARCEWTTGDASGGTRGLGGMEAQAGFDAGNRRDFVMLPGSRARAVLELCTRTNAGRDGLWRYQVRNGRVAGGCTGAGVACATGRMGLCGPGTTVCEGAATACLGEVQPAPERCDGIDNDCNGTVDDGAALCAGGRVCDRGLCVDPCRPELGCFASEVCSDRQTCVPRECAAVTCPSGQRCQAGRCVGQCTDVACPHGAVCRAGRCVDPCAGVTCGTNQVCEGGRCAAMCPCSPCGAGLACRPDGRCVAAACATVTCPAGSWCNGGACADACAGARCPAGERCAGGACVRDPAATDAGVTDAGVTDAGRVDAGVDAGAPDVVRVDVGTAADTGERADAGPRVDAGAAEGAAPPGGCGCRAGGGARTAGWAWALLAMGVVTRRRRPPGR